MSIRATERLTGLDRDTIGDLILMVGENCQRLLEAKIQERGSERRSAGRDLVVRRHERKDPRRSRLLAQSLAIAGRSSRIERETKLILAHKSASAIAKRAGRSCSS